MWTYRVVVAPPVFDHDLCLLQCVEDFAVEQFIAQLAVEALAVAVLPWAAWFDVGGLSPDGSDPVAKGLGHKLRAVVGAYVRRSAPRDKQLAECLDNVDCLQLPRDADGQALTGELVDDAQHPERLSVVGAVSNEVIGPDMVGPLRPQTDARAVVEPQTTAFRLFAGDFQPLTSPDPLDTLLVHRPAGSTQQRRDPAVSVAAILAGKFDDVGSQCCLVIGCRWGLSLRRSMLTQGSAGPSLGDAKLGRDVIHAGAAAGGA